MTRCIICGADALIKRHFSGENYCLKHAKEKLIISKFREVKNKSEKLGPNKTYIVVGRYPPEYDFLTDIIDKYFSNFTTDIEISNDYHSPNFTYESKKIILEYTRIEELIKRENALVIVIKTADLIAHDILFLILEKKFKLLESLKLLDNRKLILPLKNLFQRELSLILGSKPEPYYYCSTYDFIQKTMNTRPTLIYSILNYTKNLSLIKE